MDHPLWNQLQPVATGLWPVFYLTQKPWTGNRTIHQRAWTATTVWFKSVAVQSGCRFFWFFWTGLLNTIPTRQLYDRNTTGQWKNVRSNTTRIALSHNIFQVLHRPDAEPHSMSNNAKKRCVVGEVRVDVNQIEVIRYDRIKLVHEGQRKWQGRSWTLRSFRSLVV